MFSNDHHVSDSAAHTQQTFLLTEAQEGIWYAQRLDPLNPIVNTAHCTDFMGQVELSLLVKAINQTLREADALSLRLIDTADGPRQYLDPSYCPSLEVIDLRHHADALAVSAQAMQADYLTAIDPTQTPLASQRLYRISDTHCQWYQRVHHLAADGYGMALIENRATQLYEIWRKGHEDHAKPLTSFIDVIADDERYRSSEVRAQNQSYWLQQLDGAEEVASLSASAALTAHSCLYAHAPVQQRTLGLLLAAQEQYECSWPDILTALCAAYLQRHTRQSQVVLGMPWMGRLGNISARAVATVMNIAPLVLHIDERASIKDFLKDSAKSIRQARRHGRYRSEQLRRDLGLLQGMRRLHGPLVNILPFDAPYELEGVEAKQRVLCAGPVEDININLRSAPDASGLRIELEANPKLYRQDDIDAHLKRLLHFLEQALAAPSLQAVPSLTPDEQAYWVGEQNLTQHPIPSSTLNELVAQQCLEFADHTALVFKGEQTTYKQFAAHVTNIANHLAAMGVKRGDLVAVMLERSSDMVLCLHGILAAGAAYLPLDPSQATERTQRILSIATPKVVITSNQQATSNAVTVRDLIDVPASTQTIRPPAPSDPAYVLYTSGSTGDPKGVVVSHRAIVNRLIWMKTHYQLDHTARFLQKTPYTFDVSLWELFLPMLCGAPLVIAEPEQHKDPYALLELIEAERISVVHFVPSMLNVFLSEPRSQGLSIDYVFCSGEALSAALCKRFYSQIRGQLHNLYGPTEAAVDVSFWPIAEGCH